MKRVLFADDEPNILQGLRRMLRSQRKVWDMQFVENAQDGLEAMREAPFDIVISDMKMPGMDGAEFLDAVKELCPDSIRIILSGHSEKAAVMKSVGPTHQYLAKPCDPDVLKATIEKAYALREMLTSQPLKELAAQLQTIPSLPTLYREIVTALQNPRSSLEQVGQIIEKDIGMSAKILKIVNSAYFGLLRPVNTVPRAVSYLGLETVNSLVMSSQIFSKYEETVSPGFSMDALWKHSLDTAACARTILKAEKLESEVADDAQMAAMLHDVGRVVLAGNLPERYAEVCGMVEQGVSDDEAERAVFQASHAEVGAYVMGLWGLPDSIVDAIAYHSKPRLSPSTGLQALTIVHAADALANELTGRAKEPDGLDLEYLCDLGLDERVPVWRESCEEVLLQEADA